MHDQSGVLAVASRFNMEADDLPLEAPHKVPNAETRAAMAEADEMIRSGRAGRFATVDEMLDSFHNVDERP